MSRNNEIENITPQVTRFLDRMMNTENIGIYNDNQNVHNHNIQESIRNSIENLMNQNFKIDNDEIKKEILEDKILECKQEILEYIDDVTVHSVLLITFEELLNYVWRTLEIKRIMNEEMRDSICKCYTGRIARLINCLSGYSELVNIKIGDNDQIVNIIILMKNQLGEEYSEEKHKRLVIKELKERGFSEEVIEEWIGFI